MRDVPAIWEAWRSGRYLGDNRASTRVTVEKTFWLRTTDASLGVWNRGPARWFQRDITNGAEAAGQIETEVPNIETITINRSIEQDAGTCDFTLSNFVQPTLGAPEVPPGQLGEPGFYTFDHGQAQDARSRWGHVVNPWADLLVPNALVRTYQGFGGNDKTIIQAQADGNIVLNGVWLVDSVSVGSDGKLQVRCRDMAKLLLDQLLYPPLVPRSLYPLLYQRYKINQIAIGDAPCPNHDSNPNTTIYATSSTDEYYGTWDTNATGHRPSLAFDWSYENIANPKPGDLAFQRSYWLSEPKGNPTDSVWIEWTQTGPVDHVYCHPWAGNYLVMVSIFEHGAWVPPEDSGLGGWTPQGIPYVMTFTSNWEGGTPAGADDNIYDLPRDYFACERVRFTITNLTRAQEGGYRAGMRKLISCWRCKDRFPYIFASASIRPNQDQAEGYWQVRWDGKIYAFGDAVIHTPTSNPSTHDNVVIGMTAHPNGLGYWTVDGTGRIVSYGSAAHYGDASGQGRHDVWDITATPSGNGYWLVCRDGHIYCYGDAQFFGHATVTGVMPSGAPKIARSIESHPDTQGYWVLISDGEVQAFNLAHFGNANRNGFTGTEYVASIRRTSTGSGYWIPSGSSIVQAFGDAPWIANGVPGDPAEWAAKLCWDIVPSSNSDHGYATQHADGNLDFYGDFHFFGSAGAKYADMRTPGNYKDYADIVRELILWAGFHHYGAPAVEGKPAVYGNIESTGIFSEEDLKADMWDKKTIFDAIKQLKEIVGYVIWIDAEGGFRFESPNWYSPGNFDYAGTALAVLPEIDERVNLRSHNVTFSAETSRSEIVVANENPVPEVEGQQPASTLIETRMVPLSSSDLKGIVCPAVWSNGVFLNLREQQVLADLIAMQIWFNRRTASVSCVANPLIEPNDQVRIYERTTGEVYVHYVRSTNITHDLNTGDFSMTLNTHWLGGSAYGRSSLYFACDNRPQNDGYWQVNAYGMVVSFGNAQSYESPSGQAGHQNPTADSAGWVNALRSTKTGLGFYTLDGCGTVKTYGDAVHYGDIIRNPSTQAAACDLALTPSGNGYWILCYDGTITAFGDAQDLGGVTITGTTGGVPGGANRADSIEAHPSQMGYWVLEANGHVDTFGACRHFGDANRVGFTGTEYVHDLRCTSTGNGYYILSGSGIMQAFGDAVYYGNASRDWPVEKWVTGLCWGMLVSDDGYAIQRAEGTLEVFGGFVERGASNAWTGPTALWGLMTEEEHTKLSDPTLAYPVPVRLMKFLQATGSAAPTNAVAANFGLPPEPTIKALTE